MEYAIPSWETPAVPVAGGADVFPVRHIYCVGRNYAEHAKEMGGDATKEPPFFFALVFGYAVGLDMTRRDLQNDMREKKRPWDIGKSFAQAAPIAPLHRVSEVGHLAKGAITLDVNGARRQTGDLADMVWDVPHMIAFLSTYYELLPGDLIFSGTPSGVAAVVPGDRLDARIDGLTSLSIVITPPRA